MIETARSVDVELEPNDISIAHGQPSKNSQRQRNIIVKFTRRVKRDEVFNAHRKLKSKRTKDLPSVQIQSESSSVMHQSIPAVPISPPPGNHGAFIQMSVPGVGH